MVKYFSYRVKSGEDRLVKHLIGSYDGDLVFVEQESRLHYLFWF